MAKRSTSASASRAPAGEKASAPRSKSKAGAAKGEWDESIRMVVLAGADLYLRTEHLAKLRHALEEKLGTVEVIRYDGGKGEGVSTADVLDECRSMSLMQTHKIVVVDRAEQLLAGEGNRRLFERYAESPEESVTLVLRAETWRKGNLDAMIEQVGRIVSCDPPRSDMARGFCIQRAEKEHHAVLDAEAANLLVERIGTDLARLDCELAKLALMADNGAGPARITRDLVAEEVGAAREEKAWVLQSALVSEDPAEAVRTVRELLDVSRQPAELLRFYMIDLARKVYAAGRMLESGMRDREVFSALRLFGDGGGAVLTAARKLSPAAQAELMRLAVETDIRAKSGLGDPERGLELLALRFVGALHGWPTNETADSAR